MRYLELLEQLDRWQQQARNDHPGVIPCRRGCAACCHGPFDISIADIEVVREAIALLPAARQAEVHDRAAAEHEALREACSEWVPPYSIAAIGDDVFDHLSDRFAARPCPLLDAEQGCLIYSHRPMVCRMMGLGMLADAGDVIENDCPIQDRFPDYRVLEPQPFPLLAWEREEEVAKREAAGRLFGDAAMAGFETTIAGAIVLSSGESR
jgi:Fe-S-cluster containining protein